MSWWEAAPLAPDPPAPATVGGWRSAPLAPEPPASADGDDWWKDAPLADAPAPPQAALPSVAPGGVLEAIGYPVDETQRTARSNRQGGNAPQPATRSTPPRSARAARAAAWRTLLACRSTV